jgi:hypothetical protein
MANLKNGKGKMNPNNSQSDNRHKYVRKAFIKKQANLMTGLRSGRGQIKSTQLT